MPDTAFATAGYHAEVGVFGGGVGWWLSERSPLRDDTGFAVRIDTGVAYWHGYGRPTDYPYLFDFSLTPTFRWTFAQTKSPRLFVEGGLGAHLLSGTRINTHRDFGIAFQFGSTLGVGVAFGERNRYEIKGYVQHVSNASTNRDNWGLTTPGIALSMTLP